MWLKNRIPWKTSWGFLFFSFRGKVWKWKAPGLSDARRLTTAHEDACLLISDLYQWFATILVTFLPWPFWNLSLLFLAKKRLEHTTSCKFISVFRSMRYLFFIQYLQKSLRHFFKYKGEMPSLKSWNFSPGRNSSTVGKHCYTHLIAVPCTTKVCMELVNVMNAYNWDVNYVATIIFLSISLAQNELRKGL